MLLLVASGCGTRQVASAPAPAPQPDSYRIYDVAGQGFVELEALVTQLAASDVIFFGEMHDDRIAHQLELSLFDFFSRQGRGALAMEMFERDVQAQIDAYARGEVTEAEFTERARAWPNYATDYRPMVVMARTRGWRVVGTNVPQRHAQMVARGGLASVDTLSAEERRHVAAELICPRDGYWTRFTGAMTEGADSAGAAHSIDGDALVRMYEAQCARDETMAETIAELVSEGPVFHVNGSFHTDYRQGIPERLVRRVPGLRISVLSAVPVGDLAAPGLEEHAGRADYVIFTRGGS